MKRNILLQPIVFVVMLFATFSGICQTGVQIGGAVYGGGRRADVTGNSYVAVVNADTIGAVYGGNDIAGGVQGTEGSRIQIGRESTTAAFGSTAWTTGGMTSTTLKIGSVYGGGNGYYIYPDPIGDEVAADESSFTIDAGNTFELKYHLYTGNGTAESPFAHTEVVEDTLSPGIYYIPTINKTQIDVYSEFIFIDSLFGGAKNAFVGVEQVTLAAGVTAYAARPASADVNIHNGTIYSLFGGNNYGGVITNLLDIAVSMTYKPTFTSEQSPTGYSSANLGVTHGIKYLFGGGNRVAADTVSILVSGGQIDTAFAGGNSATVAGTCFKVETGTSNRIFGTGFETRASFLAFDGETTISDALQTTEPTYPFNAKGGYLQADGTYKTDVPEDNTNVYNIRTLFGGNNRAAMDCLPRLSLVSGGIGTIYGGGNAGDMTFCGTKEGPIANPLADAAVDDTIISTCVELTSPDLYADYVYGGCQIASVDYGTYVRIRGAKVGHVFGGCNISGDVGSFRRVKSKYYVYDVNGNRTDQTYNLEHTANTWVLIEQGARIFQNVFGGANGYYHCADVNGEKYESDIPSVVHNNDYKGQKLPTVNLTRVIVKGGHVYGDLYAGGNMAAVGFDQLYPFSGDIVAPNVAPDRENGVSRLNIGSDTIKDGSGNPTTISQPVILGNVYGGGNMASIHGLMDMRISGRPLVNGSVYGGNDKSGHVESNYRGSFITDNLLETSDGTLRTSDNASVYVRVMGTPKIGAVYGGGNGNYNYGTDGTDPIGNKLCNPNDRPEQTSTYVDINVADGAYIGEVYGGGNNVTVNDKVTVLINCSGTVRPTRALVGTVYGGNNRAAMSIVPDIVMRRGRVHDVYGGGNAGEMNGIATREEHTGVSTYVLLNSREVYVSGTIYGGSNQSRVAGNTLVALEAGKVETIFGGNNISGHVHGQTHVHINGGEVTQVYGGSNGYYTYHTVAGGSTEVYPFGTTSFLPANIVGYGDMPDCHGTYVMLHGGIVHNNVYGGGYAGTCDSTLVEVKGTTLLSGAVTDAIYGGGRGNSQQLGFCAGASNPRLGRVKHVARVQLYSLNDTSSIGKVYGGGDAGDVGSSYVELHPSFVHHFTHMYAGCRAADVENTATMVLNGMVHDTLILADTVYGGNDVAGRVARTNLIINRGRYGAAFGGGNGDYNYRAFYKNLHELSTDEEFNAICWDSIPSTHEVQFTINDRSLTGYDSTFFSGYVSGGGNMALVGSRYIKSTVAVADTQYGRIELNIHGGYFAKRVFGGARGKAAYSPASPSPFFGLPNLQLVYGLKQINMDGGSIMLSLHGGSEFINDGYPYECKGSDYTGQLTPGDASDNTTMRPSSIVNIVGGDVTKSVYGGGFEGTIYGSIYVNIGKEAVENSEVWTLKYGKASHGYIHSTANENITFAQYKPQVTIDGRIEGVAQASDMARGSVYLQHGIYAGSDWGDAGKQAFFNTPGVYGGETNIHIDGNGYVSYNTEELADNMLISQGIFGSGTSTEGGDVNRKIQFFNYGKSECHTTERTMHSIQRADTVLLDHVYLTFTGTEDAYSAYPSQNYSINRVRNLILRDDNHIVLEAPAIYIDTIESLKRVTSENSTTQVEADTAAYKGWYTPYAIGDNEVDNSNTLCDAPSASDCGIMDDEGNRNVLLIDNGGYVSVQGFDDATGNAKDYYGPVIGYCYLGSGDGWEVNVFARTKTVPSGTPGVANAVLNNGFWSLCDTNNKNHAQNSSIVNEGTAKELSYITAQKDGGALGYRIWYAGNRDVARSRAVTIVANQNPEGLSENEWLDAGTNYPEKGDWHPSGLTAVGGGDSILLGYAIAKASVDLPPANAGSYYTISNVIIDAENAGEMMMVKAAWDPELTGEDKWVKVSATSDESDGRNIETNPSYKFGLLFKLSGDLEAASGAQKESMVIAGHNRYSNTSSTDETRRVATGSVGVINKLNFYLTYSTEFSRTLVRTITFTLKEMIPVRGTNGTITSYVESPIEMTVNVATIIDTFRSFNARTLAMYNEGIDHKYVRKVVLPAAYEQRELYLTGIKWAANTECGNGLYNLTDTTRNVAESYVDANGIVHTTAKDGTNIFSVTMEPGEDVGNSTSAGWYAVEGEASGQNTIFDIRDLYDKEFTSPTNVPLPASTLRDGTTPGMLYLPEGNMPTESAENYNAAMVAWIRGGQRVGILDGRATAALYFTLFYNGNLVYADCSKLGEMTLTFAYIGPKDKDGKNSIGTFDVALTQWSRAKGDTIYIASTPTFNGSQGGVTRTVGSSTLRMKGYDYEFAHSTDAADMKKWRGKKPNLYLTSFEQALQPPQYDNDGDVSMAGYISGDVIAIIDKMVLGGDSNVVIHGSDENNDEYAMVQVIRYSGTHYQLPGEYGAYRGPLIELKENAQLGLFNMWINGSGFTRTKPAGSGTGITTTFGGRQYYENAKWGKDTLFVNDPMIVVKDNATLNMVNNVRISNAISRANNRNAVSPADHLKLGAAIALVKNGTGTPRVVLGDNTNIFNNAILNRSFYNSLQTGDKPLPGNSGAAVHVSDGTLQIGSDKSGSKVLVTDNYYLWEAPVSGGKAYIDNGQGGITDGTTTYTWNGEAWKNGDATFVQDEQAGEKVYAIIDMKDSTRITDQEKTPGYGFYMFNHATKKMRNNVSLVRTAKPASNFATITDPVVKADTIEKSDAKSNLILLRSTLNKDAKVGVSKWFPGGAPSYARDIRDTIAFAYAPSSPEVVRLAHVNGNFFADSMDYGIDTFYHNLVSPYKLYLHRCATFSFNNTNDIYYHWDAAAHCPGSTDELHVNLTSGMLPYTYTWYGYKTKLVSASGSERYEIDKATEVLMRKKTTTATIAHEMNISTPGHEALVKEARTDALQLTTVEMPAGVNVDRYYYEVTVTDLAGCKLKNNAMVKLVKSKEPFVDETNYLGRVVPSGNRIDWAVDDAGNQLDNITIERVNSETKHAVTSGLDSNFYHYRLKYKKDGEIRDTVLYRYNAITKGTNDTNKYLRFFESYELTARVSPSGQYGTIYYWDHSKEEDNWTVIAGLKDPYSSSTDEVVTKVLMCYGGGLRVKTVSKQDGNKDMYDFMYWNFNPSASPEEAFFEMPNEKEYTLGAFYAPKDYWYQQVTSYPGTASYEVDYRGNVHVKDENGLAWLISTVNGLNYQQAQTFVFDTIFLEAEVYNMEAYRWTPLGTIDHPFRGTVVSTQETDGSSIKGIFCNESELPYVGLFGVLDSARIGNTAAHDTNASHKIRLADSYFANNNYAGTLAGRATNGTQVYNVEIAHSSVSGENAMGGMFGYAENSTMQYNKVGIIGNGLRDAPDGDNNTLFTAGTSVIDPSHANEKIHYFGTSIYLGGMVGVMGGGNTIRNNAIQKHDASVAQPLYAGGIAGKVSSSASGSPAFLRRLFGAKSGSGTSIVENNYVGMQTSDQSFRVGGLVGDASDVALRNNYAYGNLKSWGNTGNLVAMSGSNVEIEHCFYNSTLGGTTGIAVNNGSLQVSDTSAFKGSGNQVKTSTIVDGIDNVTVLLNKYVREQGNGTLLWWRSDLENRNSGFPVFGTPDTIPVYTYLHNESCDSYEWQGTTYTEDGIYRHRHLDTVLMVDSITTMYLTLNHSTALLVTDSVALGDDYNGHGFRLTYEQIMRRLAFVDMDEVHLLLFTDSLLTEHGCDSVVSLWLTVYKKDLGADTIGIEEPAAGSFLFDVRVYPNPTLGTITVESEGLQQVEIYDNVSRKVMQSSATGNSHQMNLSRLSAGAYYVRVTTEKGVAVKKVIKK